MYSVATIKFNVQHSTMSPVLPSDIIIQIIDLLGENKETAILKELALVSHSFLQFCSKHLFATIELHSSYSSSKRGFVKLIKSRPDVVNYIRKLTYNFGDKYFPFPLSNDDSLFPPIADDVRLLSSILPNLLRSIPNLNCLKITASMSDWKKLDSSLTSALLHLMHLPTINRIDLSYIDNFPMSSLIPCFNLLRLDVSCLRYFYTHEFDGDTLDIVQSEVMPKLREFHTSGSDVLTRKLLQAITQDRRPAFNPSNLRRLSLFADQFEEDTSNIRYLLQNANLLEELRLPNGLGSSIVGLYDILSPIARTLKVLYLTTPFHCVSPLWPPIRLCEELEAMAGHNVLEDLTYTIDVGGYETEDEIGPIIQKVGEVLIKPGWSALKQVTFKVEIAYCLAPKGVRKKLSEELQSLPDKYLSHLSKQLEFNYSAYVVKFKCVYDYDRD